MDEDTLSTHFRPEVKAFTLQDATRSEKVSKNNKQIIIIKLRNPCYTSCGTGVVVDVAAALLLLPSSLSSKAFAMVVHQIFFRKGTKCCSRCVWGRSSSITRTWYATRFGRVVLSRFLGRHGGFVLVVLTKNFWCSFSSSNPISFWNSLITQRAERFQAFPPPRGSRGLDFLGKDKGFYDNIIASSSSSLLWLLKHFHVRNDHRI